MHKKIAIIGTVGLPANYGGFETLTDYLTKYLANKYNITVYCSSKSYDDKLKTYNNAQLKYIPLHANGVQSVLYDIISIFNALKFADTLLVLGVSGCVVLPFVKLVSKKNIIVNIDGLDWKRAKWGKAASWFLKYSEKLAVKYADKVVSDNVVIQHYVKNTYNVKSELIAYGSDHCRKEELTQETIEEHPFLNMPYAFKVCRIEPENNVQIILEAFSNYPDLNLVIVGNWNKSDFSEKLRLQFVNFGNIYMLDPIYEQVKLNQLRSNCRVYIHGHSAGGTNPSLVEAMYLKLPIITYDVNFNKETTANKALYFNTPDQLVHILKNVNKESLLALGDDMKRLAEKEYLWEGIAHKYESLM